MEIIKNIFFKYDERKRLINETCDNYISQIDNALREIQELFVNPLDYIEPNKRLEWRNQNLQLIQNLDSQNIKKYRKANNFKKLIDKMLGSKEFVKTL